jgi:hypothetical protein
MPANGTTQLSEEQQEWYLQRFRVKYVQVQQTPGVPNRRARRLAKRKRKEV